MRQRAPELVALGPGSASGHWLMGLALEGRGEPVKAIAEFQAGLAAKDDSRTLCALSHAYGMAGDSVRAMATMHRYFAPSAKELTRYTGCYCAAFTFASQQQKDKAFEWLDKERMTRDASFPFFPRDSGSIH